MATKSTYVVLFSGGKKSLKDANAVRRWVDKHSGAGCVQVWGFSPSLDAYVWLQTVHV